MLRLTGIVLSALCMQCDRHAPDAVNAAATASSTSLVGAASPNASVAPLPVPGTEAGALAAPFPSADAWTSPSAGEGDPGKLPQTDAKPTSSSPVVEAHARALFDAIASDDPEKGMPFFFPVSAYEQVKDVARPAADWKHRLVGNYVRDIHTHARRLASDAARPKFVRIDIPEARARWVKPGEEGNKLGYYRVYGSKLVYEIDGRERAVDLTSLISWRGEWYVVHLTGFK